MGKVAISSSIAFDSPPENAVNGKWNNGRFRRGGGACVHTNQEPSFISVDLDGEYLISSIKLVGRGDICDGCREQTVWMIRIGNTGSSADPICSEKFDAYGGYLIELHCNNMLSGRHVRMESDTYMVLCEIQVFGDKIGNSESEISMKLFCQLSLFERFLNQNTVCFLFFKIQNQNLL